MVKFVSYSGAFPNLCAGELVLNIAGKDVKFPPHFIDSGGYIGGSISDLYVVSGYWTIDLHDYPEFEPMRAEIEACINENVPHGCCGGCI